MKISIPKDPALSKKELNTLKGSIFLTKKKINLPFVKMYLNIIFYIFFCNKSTGNICFSCIT